jgi:hypothetical protein
MLMQTHLASENFEHARKTSNEEFPKKSKAFCSFLNRDVNIDFGTDGIIYTYIPKEAEPSIPAALEIISDGNLLLRYSSILEYKVLATVDEPTYFLDIEIQVDKEREREREEKKRTTLNLSTI